MDSCYLIILVVPEEHIAMQSNGLFQRWRVFKQHPGRNSFEKSYVISETIS